MRRYLFWPAFFITAGVLLLLANLGVIEWGTIARLASLWPVILIWIGARLIARSRPEANARMFADIVSLVVLAALVVYAVVLPVKLASVYTTASGARGTLQTAHLKLDLSAAKVSISGENLGADLYTIRFQYPEGTSPKVQFDAANGNVTINDNGTSFNWLWSNTTRETTIALNSNVKWSIDTGGGATTQNYELSSTTVASFTASGGASNITLKLGQPEGTVPLAFNGGAMTVTVHRSDGAPVRVTANGGASSFNADGTSRSVLGGSQTWQSPEYGTTESGYDITLNGGASSLTVDAY